MSQSKMEPKDTNTLRDKVLAASLRRPEVTVISNPNRGRAGMGSLRRRRQGIRREVVGAIMGGMANRRRPYETQN